MSFHVPEQYRLTVEGSPWADSIGIGTNNGTFQVPCNRGKKPVVLRVIASDGMGWEHVSVSLPSRTPTWDEMCFIKEMFWDDEDLVVQYHPPKSEHVNCHPYCLHLWRPIGREMPAPESILVGPKGIRANLRRMTP